MVKPAEPITEVLCWVCGVRVETPVRRWLGIMPVCRRCAEYHSKTFKVVEEDSDVK